MINKNINTEEYWENRFKFRDWGHKGKKQTREYALANVQHLKLGADFKGAFLDFGCALGDAIPVYKLKFPNASIFGYDISPAAIQVCKKNYSKIALFFTGGLENIPEVDVIIASHVMEHLTNDKEVIVELLQKCKELYVFVPYKESPLYFEHVNYYDENYYEDIQPTNQQIFDVIYKHRNSVRGVLKGFLNNQISFYKAFSKKVIMFQFNKV